MRANSRWIAAGCAAVLLFGVPAAANAGGTTVSGLGNDLDALLGGPALAGGAVGLVVRDADTGATLYSRQADTLLAPASNEKLVTSAAALDVLGPDYTFQTSVSSTGTRSGSTLDGDLYLKGTGDPTMLAADYHALADAVAASGVTTVTGRLVADDTFFDSTRLGPGWSWDDEPYYYDAQISALTVAPDTAYGAGSVYVDVAPGQAGQPPTVTLDPPNSYVTLADTATTGAAGSARTETVDRAAGSNTITVTGSIPAGAATERQEMSVDNPTGYAASLFRAALAADGVTVAGPNAYQATPSTATQIVSHSSMPLSQLLVPFLKLSNNMIAEALTKAAGQKVFQRGTFAAGVHALTTKLAALGIDPNAYNQFDGSGLSRMDVVSPDQLANVLAKAETRPWFQTWYNALPVAGNPAPLVGGTLAHRMAGTAAANNVHAKTGSMTGVSSLSGYVTAADGQHLVFSLVENNFVPASVSSVEDAVAVRLAQYTGASDAAHPQLKAPAAQSAARGDRRAALECSWTHTC
jgi:serine-type D-Ala-D-Ala carboxypeptidase/endopeptidase (penicillin-binding protein 4)